MWAEGLPTSVIGEALGVHSGYIRKLAGKRRDMFPARNGNQPPTELRAKASEIYKAGATILVTAQTLGLPKTTVAKWARTYRDLFPKRESIVLADDKGGEALAKAVVKRAEHRQREEWPDKAPGFDGVTSAALKPCGCRWPLWGHHESFDYDTSLFCGAPRIKAGSYCAFHAEASVGPGTRSERGAIKAARTIHARELARGGGE